MHDAFRENGFWGAAAAGQIVGLDVQVYGPSKTVEKANVKAPVLKALDDIGYTKLASDAYAANLPALQAKIGTAGNYKTLAELYKAHMTPTGDFKPTRTQIEQREKDFRALPAVKKIKASIQQRETAILKAAPPGLAQAAYEAGEVDLTVAQKRILGIK